MPVRVLPRWMATLTALASILLPSATVAGAQERTTSFLNDALGSPVVGLDVGGAVVWRAQSADLVVESVSLSPTHPTTVDQITFSAIVKNVGTGPAGPSTASFRVGGETFPPTFPVPALLAGESHSLRRHLRLGVAQRYRTTVVVDVNHDVPESNEANNEKWIAFNVSPAGVADLIVESVSLTPTNPTTDDQITFSAALKNVGTGPAGPSTASFKVGGETFPPTFPVPALLAGESHSLQRQLRLGVAQRYRTTVVVDVNHDVLESNEANNEKWVAFNVSPAGVADLIVEGVALTPTNPTTVDQITFSAIVKNVGTGPAGPSTASFQVGVETAPPTFPVPAMLAGQSHPLQRQLTLGDAGNYRTTVVADVNDVVLESDEANNEKWIAFSVSPAGSADLVVESVALTPTNPTTVDQITFLTIVKNVGTGPAGPSTASFQVGAETPPPTFSVPALSPGQSHSLKRQRTLAVAGNYTTTVVVDINDVVLESNEANNDTWTNFSVSTASDADLIVESLALTPTNPTTIDQITFSATVKNVGTGPAGPSTASFQVGVETTPPTFSVPALSPGQSHSLQRQLTLGTAQGYRTTVTADVNHDVIESNDANNATWIDFSVSPAPSGHIPTLHWQTVPGASKYEVELDADGQIHRIQRSSAGVASLGDFGVVASPSSTYRLRVRALDGAGLPGAWSPWREISDGIELRTPSCVANPTTGIQFTTTFGYDNLGHIQYIDHPTNGSPRQEYAYGVGVGPKSVKYDGASVTTNGRYSIEGTLKSFNYGPLGGAQPFAGGSLTRTFDPLGRLNVTTAQVAGVNNYSFDVDYNAAGRVEYIRRQFAAGQTQFHYTYGNYGELKSDAVSGAGGNGTITYQYDSYGNLQSRTGLSTATLSVPAQPATTFNSFNHNTSFTYDNAGRVVDNGTLGFTYNALDQISQVQTNTGTTIAAFFYDGNGERVRSDHDRLTRYSIRDLDGRVISHADYEPSPQGCWEQSREIDYVYFDNGVMMSNRKAGGTDKRRYFIRDFLGSPTVLFDQASGFAPEEYAYSPYGHQMVAANAGKGAFQFGGYERDDATGLDYAHARYYDRQGARFFAPDAARDFDLTNPFTSNLYQYARGNPISFVDPGGLQACQPGAVSTGVTGERMIANLEAMDHLGYGRPTGTDPHAFRIGGLGIPRGSTTDCSTATLEAFVQARQGDLALSENRIYRDLYRAWQITDPSDPKWRMGAVGALVDLELGEEITSLQDIRRGDIVQGWRSQTGGHSFVVTSVIRDATGLVIGFNMISAQRAKRQSAPAITEEVRLGEGGYQELYIGRIYDPRP